MSNYFDVFCEFPFQDSDWDEHVAHAILGDMGMKPASGWWDSNIIKDDDTEEDWRMGIHANSNNGIFMLEYRRGYTNYRLPGTGPWGEGGPTVTRFNDPPENHLSWWPYEGW